MMEGNLLNIFAFMGGLSLYIVIATIVGRGIYSFGKRRWNEEGRFAAAIVGGAFFPISVPIGIGIFWIWSIVSIPLRNGGDQNTDVEECAQEVSDVSERVGTLERSNETTPSEPETVPKAKFKAGDLITGIKGNPAGYKHLYEGSACRVLEVEGGKPMKVVLVDHIDFNAHRESIGEEFRAPQRYFTLMKSVAKKKAVTKKKKPKRKVAKKK